MSYSSYLEDISRIASREVGDSPFSVVMRLRSIIDVSRDAVESIMKDIATEQLKYYRQIHEEIAHQNFSKALVMIEIFEEALPRSSKSRSLLSEIANYYVGKGNDLLDVDLGKADQAYDKALAVIPGYRPAINGKHKVADLMSQ